MKNREQKISHEILDYQPDAIEIEERPVPGKVRWVLYLIIGSMLLSVIGMIVLKVDRIVVSQGKLITTAPNIVVQSINTAVIRSIKIQVGDSVEKGQVLATLDQTFASADLSQLTKQSLALSAQIRRIKAELAGITFSAKPEEGEDGLLQAQIHHQRQLILDKRRRTVNDKSAALKAQIALYGIQRQGHEKQFKILRDVEGTTAKLPQKGHDYRLRLLETQKAKYQASSTISTTKAEEEVTRAELKQVESEWQQFVEERNGELMEQEVQLRYELEKIQEDLTKAIRMNELVSLRAPEKGIVLKLAQRTEGSIIQQAEPFIILVPQNSIIEVEVNVNSSDIGRIRIGDDVRVKIDAFPFQRHGTLPGKVRVISEDAFQDVGSEASADPAINKRPAEAVYRTRISIRSNTLRNVPEGFRIIPGMKVRAEIKVGKRSVISYFLYPVIRSLDESLREP